MRTIKSKSLLPKEAQFATVIVKFAKAFAKQDPKFAETNWKKVRAWAIEILDNPRNYSEETQKAAASLLQRQPGDYVDVLEKTQKMHRLENGESTENVDAVVKYVDAPRDALL